MEIVLDISTVRRIATDELAQARADIVSIGAVAAYERSRERHDSRLAQADDAPTLACRSGCYWCCYFSVDVRPIEVFAILDFAQRELSDVEWARVREEIAANNSLLRTLSDQQRAQRNIKCPFLSAGRCSIYAARPQTCRNYHATDAKGCELSFEQPDNLDIDPEFAPHTYQIGGTHVEAFSKALHEAGYDCDAYELNAALAAALADPEDARALRSQASTIR